MTFKDPETDREPQDKVSEEMAEKQLAAEAKRLLKAQPIRPDHCPLCGAFPVTVEIPSFILSAEQRLDAKFDEGVEAVAIYMVKEFPYTLAQQPQLLDLIRALKRSKPGKHGS